MNRGRSRGFTLLEIMVTLTIIVSTMRITCTGTCMIIVCIRSQDRFGTLGRSGSVVTHGEKVGGVWC